MGEWWHMAEKRRHTNILPVKQLQWLKVSTRDTHYNREETQRRCRPRLLGDGDKGPEIVRIIFCTGPTRAAKVEQKSLVPTRQAQRTNQERTTFICTLCVPIYLSFNSSQQGPTLSALNYIAAHSRPEAILPGRAAPFLYFSLLSVNNHLFTTVSWHFLLSFSLFTLHHFCESVR
jgi:hypothetical protein